MRMGIVSFSAGSKAYKFKEPLMLEQENLEDRICLFHKELRLVACGSSLSECEKSIREELAMVWDDYALAPDDELTAEAIVFKNKLLAMADEVK